MFEIYAGFSTKKNKVMRLLRSWYKSNN